MVRKQNRYNKAMVDYQILYRLISEVFHSFVRRQWGC